MHMRISCLLLLLFICVSYSVGAQTKGKYPPFVVNEEAITATLKVKDWPAVEKFAAVFKKHKLDATSAEDWNGVLDQITGMKETDIYISKNLSFEVVDDGVEIMATHLDDLEQVLKFIRLVIATPQKLDVFLTEQETLLKKKLK